MKRVLCMISLAAMTVFPGRAQKQANNWFFGRNAGLTWNTTREMTVRRVAGTGTASVVLKGLPDFVAGSSIRTVEGCFSLSDDQGQLLFYSDGITVWNREHAVMPNGAGLTGHSSSTQSGIIIPNPGHPSQYMTITVAEYIADNLSWSVIDMTLDGGLGDVVAGQKNIPFTGHSGQTGETFTSIKHANGIDYWILAPGRGGSPTYMNAWLVTSTGVSATPVVTALPVTNTNNSVGGYLKMSPDGRYFAWATYYNRQLIYGEFDPATGVFSHVQQVASPGTCYGLEFSASGKYVYVVHSQSPLLVYNFAELLSDPIQATNNRKTYTIPATAGQLGTIQLAPDGRMYLSTFGQSYLFVIDNPEDFDHPGIYQLPSGFFAGTALSQLGLPSFTASWFAIDIEGSESFCVNTPQDFTATISIFGTITYTEWDFGDGNAPVRDTNVTLGSQTHSYTYARSGSYTITVRLYQAGGNEVSSQTHAVKVMPCMLPVNPHVRTIAGGRRSG